MNEVQLPGESDEAEDVGEDGPSPQLPAGRVDKVFATNFRRRREALTITQAEVANQMRQRRWSWHPQTVQRVEGGQRKVTIGEAKAIAEILDTTIDRLTWPDQAASTAAILDRSIAETRDTWNHIKELTFQHLFAKRSLAAALATLEHLGYRNLEEIRERADVGDDTVKITPEGAVTSGRQRYNEQLERINSAKQIIGWTVALPNRGPSPGGLLASAATGTLDGALEEVRGEFPTEDPEETWRCEVNGELMTFNDFHRLANTPGATGRFVMSGPGGMTVTSRNAFPLAKETS